MPCGLLGLGAVHVACGGEHIAGIASGGNTSRVSSLSRARNLGLKKLYRGILELPTFHF